jgi:pimeloyl-ACP methyl ester carboxylesterase
MPLSSPRLVAAEEALWNSVDAIPREQYVELRSGPIVRVQETGDGPPVVFVHGASNSGTSWFSLMDGLLGYRCIAIDRPGCGGSTPQGGLKDLNAVKAFADDLIVEVLDALDISSAVVIATSYGGLFAIRGAAAHPDRIDRIVELSWPMGAPMDRVPMSLRFGALPGMATVMGKVPLTRGAVKMLLKQIGLKRAITTGTFSEDMITWFHTLLRDTDTIANELDATPKVILPIKGLNKELLHTDELLARVTCPVLFLWGEEDPNGGELAAEALAARFPDASLEIIREAGHAPWIDEPKLIASRTLSFLANGGTS